jgi:protein required for attachment to host cells
MKPTWVLLCGRDGARLFEHSRGEKKMQLVESFLHPEGRLKEQDIVTDRAGRNFHRIDKVSHSGGKTGDPRAHSDRLFVKELSDYLKKGRESSTYGRLYLVASPRFMGILKEGIDSQTMKSVTGFHEKNLSHFTEEDVNHILARELLL